MGLFDRLFRKQDDVARELEQHRQAQSEPPSAQEPEPAAVAGAGGVFQVHDIFFITGRGVVATGVVSAGSLQVGDRVGVFRGGQQVLASSIAGIEAFRKLMDRAEQGDNIGILLRGVERAQVQSGDEIRTI